jgi:hypothetical protein
MKTWLSILEDTDNDGFYSASPEQRKMYDSARNSVVYDDGKGNFVYVSDHKEKDISNRVWWNSWDDPPIVKYFEQGIEKITKKKFSGIGIRLALIDPSKKKALMVSTRSNKKKSTLITSFDIITVLNKDCKEFKKEPLNLAVPNNNIIVIRESIGKQYLIEGILVDDIIFID